MTSLVDFCSGCIYRWGRASGRVVPFIYESRSISEIRGVEENLAVLKEEFEDHVKIIEDF